MPDADADADEPPSRNSSSDSDSDSDDGGDDDWSLDWSENAQPPSIPAPSKRKRGRPSTKLLLPNRRRLRRFPAVSLRGLSFSPNFFSPIF